MDDRIQYGVRLTVIGSNPLYPLALTQKGAQGQECGLSYLWQGFVWCPGKRPLGRSSDAGFLEAKRILMKASVPGRLNKVFMIVASLAVTSALLSWMAGWTHENLCDDSGSGLIRCSTLQLEPYLTVANQTGTTLYLWQPFVDDPARTSSRRPIELTERGTAAETGQPHEQNKGIQTIPAGKATALENNMHE